MPVRIGSAAVRHFDERRPRFEDSVSVSYPHDYTSKTFSDFDQSKFNPTASKTFSDCDHSKDLNQSKEFPRFMRDHANQGLNPIVHDKFSRFREGLDNFIVDNIEFGTSSGSASRPATKQALPHGGERTSGERTSTSDGSAPDSRVGTASSNVVYPPPPQTTQSAGQRRVAWNRAGESMPFRRNTISSDSKLFKIDIPTTIEVKECPTNYEQLYGSLGVPKDLFDPLKASRSRINNSSQNSGNGYGQRQAAEAGSMPLRRPYSSPAINSVSMSLLNDKSRLSFDPSITSTMLDPSTQLLPGRTLPSKPTVSIDSFTSTLDRFNTLPSGSQVPSGILPSYDEEDLEDAHKRDNLDPKYAELHGSKPFLIANKFEPKSEFGRKIEATKRRIGMSRLERKLEKRLDHRLKEAEKMQRFDSLMKSDGTFKRQVWSDMIKEGVIGYNKTTKKATTDLGARDAKSFLALLKRRCGTIMRAWRNVLDMDGNGRISYHEFCKAARSVGYESSLRQLWNDLNNNDDKAFITLDELDKDTFERINYFNDLVSNNFSSLREAWDFFDADNQQQLYEDDFHKMLLKLDFDAKKYNVPLLFRDLDYDGSGFLTYDNWMFLRRWVTSEDLKQLDAFRKVLQAKHFKPAEAFHKIFDTDHNGSLDPKEFVDGFKKLGIKRGINPRRVFELLDSDGGGTITVSEFIKLFTAEPNKVQPVDEHNPLPLVEREIQSKFGINIDLAHLLVPIKKSYQMYDNVYRKLEETERADLKDLLDFSWNRDDHMAEEQKKGLNRTMKDGKSETGFKDNLPSNFSGIQESGDLDLLLEQAERAQKKLKEAVMRDKNQTWMPKTMNRNNLIDGFHEAFDPGIKTKKRCIEKADYKYLQAYGENRFKRVRDIARVSFHFPKCRDLLHALRELHKYYNVLEIDNRMRTPTALGWRDFAALVLIEDVDQRGESKKTRAGFHICEIQLQLIPYTRARDAAHKYYKVLREEIPKVCSKSSDCEALQNYILEALQTVQKGDFSQKVNTALDMDRSKIWVVPWWENPKVTRLVETNKFPVVRPSLPISSMRTEWMSGHLTEGSYPPTVPDMRDNRPWLPAGGLRNGLFQNMVDEEAELAEENRYDDTVKCVGGKYSPKAVWKKGARQRIRSKTRRFQSFDEKLIQLEYEDRIRKERFGAGRGEKKKTEEQKADEAKKAEAKMKEPMVSRFWSGGRNDGVSVVGIPRPPPDSQPKPAAVSRRKS